VNVYVLSDFHLGKGRFLETGEVNILEDFHEDERFAEFLDYHSTGTNYFSDIHVVLNGDILNLIQIDVKGIFHHFITEENTCDMIDDIVKGHPVFFEAIKRFLSRPNKKVTYVIGNHDLPMIFEKAQERLNSHLGVSIDYTHQYVKHGVLIEHGHRFESINTVPRSQTVIKGPEGKDIINYPWASLFCIYLLPKLKAMRPNVDKIRPFSKYVKWIIVHDFSFFLYLTWNVFAYLVRTQFPPYGKYNKNFRIGIRTLSKIALHPKYVTNAKRILATRPNVKIVVMGHIHVSEYRRFKDGRMYFNCGTWNIVPSIDAAMHDSINALSYVHIDVDIKKDTIRHASLNIWKGKWKPFSEEIIAS
jgi:UDP-2,3-diacylglucosamine pyrophosphatase LpxH